MRFLLSFLLTITMTAAAVAQTAEGTSAVASAVFSAVEKSLISEFFKNSELTPQELDILGDIATIITGGDVTGEAGKGKGQGRGQGQGKKKNNAGGGLPPGLANRDSLPPGLARYLEKHGTLPPGLEVRGLPTALTGLLPNPGLGRKRVVVDNDVLLIETLTGKVLDILSDVIKPERR